MPPCQPHGKPRCSPTAAALLPPPPTAAAQGQLTGAIPPKKTGSVPTWEMSPRCWHSSGAGSPVQAGGTTRGCCSTAQPTLGTGIAPQQHRWSPGRARATNPKKPPAASPQPGFISFYPPGQGLANEGAAGSWGWAGCRPLPGGPVLTHGCARADPGTVSQTPLHLWSLYRGATAAGTPPGVVNPSCPPLPMCPSCVW